MHPSEDNLKNIFVGMVIEIERANLTKDKSKIPVFGLQQGLFILMKSGSLYWGSEPTSTRRKTRLHEREAPKKCRAISANYYFDVLLTSQRREIDGRGPPWGVGKNQGGDERTLLCRYMESFCPLLSVFCWQRDIFLYSFYELVSILCESRDARDKVPRLLRYMFFF